MVDESSTILTVEETPDSDEVLVTVKGKIINLMLY